MKENTCTVPLSQAEAETAASIFRETVRAFTREAILSLVEEEVAAHEILDELTRFLSDKNQAAQESLKEGMGDMLTVYRLAIPATLNATLLSTNRIENVMKNLRKHPGRVNR
ncbi:MAG: hypothetical protein VCG02_16225 [Verrucomicrobiota bacterium]